MALVTFASEFDNTAVDFVAEFHPANAYLFQNNVNYTSPQGRVYEDVLRINWHDEPEYQARWGGTGLAFNATTKAFTAGTLTGLVAGNVSGASFTQELAVEGFSYSAVAFHTIATSASTVDDMNFVRAIFAGSDTFNLSPQADRADGFAGNDTLRGDGGNDTLLGNTGNDWLDGGLGIDRLVGGAGNDTHVVNVAGDVVVELSGGGTDTVRSAVGRTLGAYQEHLTLTGSASINGTGNTLANTITGNSAANLLSGVLGNDHLLGGSGNDTLNGGAGLDTMTGGARLDTFRFTTAPSATTNADRILDFVSADDRLQFDNAVFTALGAAGALPAAAFRLGSAAADTSDRIVYHGATGRLLYDADGTGPGAAILVATLNVGTVVTLDDLFVI